MPSPMNIEEAYNLWSEQYDSNNNKTRDLEAVSLRETLAHVEFNDCLEIGCGTGKNTEWLLTKARHVLAVDLSEEMLAVARQKLDGHHVTFVRADINKEWTFAQESFDLVTCSLVLEHIEDLSAIFQKASAIIKPGGHMYIGELHPFKQYTGTKARFETSEGVTEVQCYTHHISDFTDQAKNHGFEIKIVKEYFDDEEKRSMPRILTILFNKKI